MPDYSRLCLTTADYAKQCQTNHLLLYISVGVMAPCHARHSQGQTAAKKVGYLYYRRLHLWRRRWTTTKAINWGGVPPSKVMMEFCGNIHFHLRSQSNYVRIITTRCLHMYKENIMSHNVKHLAKLCCERCQSFNRSCRVSISPWVCGYYPQEI